MRITGGILTLLLTATTVVQGQHFHEDDIMLNETLKQMYPQHAKDIEESELLLESQTRQYEAMQAQNPSRAEQVYIIPVVIHILHENGPENVSDAEVHDALRILNEDFRKWNADTAQVVSSFKNVIGNANIEFRLARKDPQGRPHTGIDRIFTSLTNNAGENSKLNVWPRNTYMNVWVVKTIGSAGVAGYTYTPAGANFQPSRDGIILLYTYFSSVRTGTVNRSRTLTHEVGHWLNLSHPWGGSNNPGLSSNCNIDDGVFDTPNTIGWTSCNTNGSTCGSLDNVQNYMEYSYCSNMFTKGQVTRMRAALNSGVAERNALVSSTNNRKAGVLDMSLADFSPSNQVVCAGQSISYTDQSRYDAVAWEWTFEGGEPGTSTARNPIVKYPYPGTYNVVLKATGANGTSTTTSRNAYIRVNSNAGRHLPYLETFDNFTDGLSSAWVVEDEDKDHISWVTTNNGFDGNGYFLNNRDRYYGQLDALISPAIDLSNINNPILSFKYAYTRRTTNDNDMLRVYFSNDCGKTWQLRFTRSGAALQTAALTNGIFIPNGAAEWSTISINNFVSSDFTEGFLVKIELENRGGNSMYIDDFWIDGSFNFTPGLEFPRNGMTGVNEDIHLDWKAVPFVTKYEYQMSTSSVFSTMVASGEKTYLGESPINEDTRHFVAGLSANTTYYWRVRAYRGTDISPWSAVWSFTVSPTGEGYQYIDGSPVGMDAGLSSSQNIQLYPNPTNGRLTLHASSETSHLRITVYDIAGNALQVVSAEGSQITTDLSHLPSGVYILQVSADEHVSIHRIIRN